MKGALGAGARGQRLSLGPAKSSGESLKMGAEVAETEKQETLTGRGRWGWGPPLRKTGSISAEPHQVCVPPWERPLR
jgi:hypothetical protein